MKSKTTTPMGDMQVNADIFKVMVDEENSRNDDKENMGSNNYQKINHTIMMKE